MKVTSLAIGDSVRSMVTGIGSTGPCCGSDVIATAENKKKNILN